MTHTIQLELAFENDINEVHQLFVDTGIEFKILVEEGLGGGWLICELTTDESTLRKWLLENYCDDDLIGFFMGFEN